MPNRVPEVALNFRFVDVAVLPGECLDIGDVEESLELIAADEFGGDVA
jgi:hypothetical protein